MANVRSTCADCLYWTVVEHVIDDHDRPVDYGVCEVLATRKLTLREIKLTPIGPHKPLRDHEMSLVTPSTFGCIYFHEDEW